MASVEEVKVNVAASVDGTRRAVAGIQQVTTSSTTRWPCCG